MKELPKAISFSADKVKESRYNTNFVKKESNVMIPIEKEEVIAKAFNTVR